MLARGASTYPPPIVGPNWTTRFLKRHPELHIRKQKPIDILRQAACDPQAISEWFRRLATTWGEYNFLPDDVWNFDETGFRIGMGRKQRIVTTAPKSIPYTPSESSRDFASSVEAISAAGESIPPFVILKGWVIQERWFDNDLDGGVLVGVSETGYMNDQLALHWIEHFNNMSARYERGVYRLLICDGFDSHCTKEVIDYCNEHNIILFCLPPHTSHFLQPLDVNVFQTYKHYHGEAIDGATRSGCTNFNKLEFLAAFTKFRAETFKTDTIRGAFRKTGIWPRDPDLVIRPLRDAQQHNEQSLIQLEEPTTPETRQRRRQQAESNTALSISSGQTTPTTVRTLQRRLAYFEEELEKQADSSTDLLQRFQRIKKGTVVQAIVSAETRDRLKETEAAATARANRKELTRTALSKGGVMYADRARTMAQSREDKALERAEATVRREEQRIRAEQSRDEAEVSRSIALQDKAFLEEEEELERQRRSEQRERERQQREERKELDRQEKDIDRQIRDVDRQLRQEAALDVKIAKAEYAQRRREEKAAAATNRAKEAQRRRDEKAAKTAQNSLNKKRSMAAAKAYADVIQASQQAELQGAGVLPPPRKRRKTCRSARYSLSSPIQSLPPTMTTSSGRTVRPKRRF